MKKDKGKQAFLNMLDNVVSKKAGDSDDDFLLLSGTKLKNGDRVLLIWTDDEDIVVLGKVEGGDNDG